MKQATVQYRVIGNPPPEFYEAAIALCTPADVYTHVGGLEAVGSVVGCSMFTKRLRELAARHNVRVEIASAATHRVQVSWISKHAGAWT